MAVSVRKKLHDPELRNSGAFQESLSELKARINFDSLDNKELGGANLQAQALANYAKENLGTGKVEEAIELQKEIQSLTEKRLMEAMKGKDVNLPTEFPGITGIQTADAGDKTRVSMGFRDESGKQYVMTGGGEQTPVNSQVLSRTYDGKSEKNFERISERFGKDQEELIGKIAEKMGIDQAKLEEILKGDLGKIVSGPAMDLTGREQAAGQYLMGAAFGPEGKMMENVTSLNGENISINLPHNPLINENNPLGMSLKGADTKRDLGMGEQGRTSDIASLIRSGEEKAAKDGAGALAGPGLDKGSQAMALNR